MEEDITDTQRIDWLAMNADVCALSPFNCLNAGEQDMRNEIDKIILSEQG